MRDMRQMIVDLPGYIAVKSFNGSNYYKISFGERGIFPADVRTTSIQLIGANTFSYISVIRWLKDWTYLLSSLKTFG